MIYVFEDQQALNLEPLTLTRATFELRCGAVTHLERIRRVVGDQPLALVVRPQLAAVVQERYPDLEIGSYPFFRSRRFGISLVVRGTDTDRLDQAAAELKDLIRSLGGKPVEDTAT